MITIIIPAYNEEGYIGDCLRRLLQSEDPQAPQGAGPVQVIVVANGCTDATVTEARALAPDFAARGWLFQVLELAEGSKTRALNAGCAAAVNPNLIHIDADIHVTPGLIASLARALDRAGPTYAGGRPRIRKAESWVSHRYARFWERLPFMATGVPGCGVCGVNAAGRARWSEIPEVIADDVFVRCHFAPNERVAVPDTYSWPIAEGFKRLVRVRRRQNQGLEELTMLCPDLMTETERTAPTGAQKIALFLRDPIGFAIYASVALAVKTPLYRNRRRWERGRGEQ